MKMTHRRRLVAYITLLIVFPFALASFFLAIIWGFIGVGWDHGHGQACKFVSWIRGDGWQ